MNEEINAFAESSEMNHQAATESHEECRESMEESHSIVALPCEICDELCPSDKLMEHQLECRKERESARRDDPRATHHTSPGQQEFVHVFNRRHESSPIHRTSYIEVQRGYSPTIEFEDDCITNESVEDDIVSDFVVRGERITIDFPPRRGEPFAGPASSNGSGVSSAGFIEIQRSYSPTVEFVEEGNTAETFSHNIPEFVISHTRADSTRSFESRYSPRFNQTENRFEH